MRFLLLLAALGAAPCAASPEFVSIPSRPGVTQPFVILPMAGAPQAVALLYIGGGGRINARREDGQVKFGARNFLPRSAAEFARNGILPVVMDAPSDQSELLDSYRMGPEQSVDARAVVEELKRRYPGLPVYIVGTSRGTISGAYIGRDLGAEVSGVVLTSTMFGSHDLVSVSGGKPPESGPCDPFSAHGFFGVEGPTVDAIAGWMLKRSFAKQVP